MRLKSVYTTIFAIILIVAVVIWKLNEYYAEEKSVALESQLHQQTLNLKTSISSQLNQLKNIVSSYQGEIDEQQINWVQINPFFGIAQLDISEDGRYSVKKLFTKSDSPLTSWSTDFIQKALALTPFSGKPNHVQLFQNKQSEKFLVLIFSDEQIQNSRQAVALFGEASYFQKYFDTQRGAKSTNLMVTNDEVVVGHSQSAYIATRTQEGKLSPKKFVTDRDDIRSTNLSVISYAGLGFKAGFAAVPTFVLVFILGLAFLVVGLMIYVLKPDEKINRKEELFKKVFEDVKAEVRDRSPPPQADAGAEFQPTVIDAVAPAAEAGAPAPSAAPPSLPATLADLQMPAPFDVGFIAAKPSPAPVENSRVAVGAWPVSRDESGLPEPPPVDEPTATSIPMTSQLVGVKLTELGSVIDLSLATLATQIQSTGARIVKSYESRKEYEFDVDRFRKLFENIILNAIEAGAGEIEIRVYDVNGFVNVDIIDNGGGIHPDDIDKVWQPFYGTKNKLRHKGLGLSESLSVARRYGAELQIFNNLDRSGTTVRMQMDSALRTGYPADNGVLSDSEMPGAYAGDLDIDAILNLDDIVEEDVWAASASRLESSREAPTQEQLPRVAHAEADRRKPSYNPLANEFKTTQIKMDRTVEVAANPTLRVRKSEKPVDAINVKVRRPDKR